MADGHFPTLVSATRDANASTNPIFIEITDGTNLVSVSAAGNLGVEELNSAAILADTANMDTNLGTIAGAVSGTELQVDIVAPLPAGTNNIGDVDVLSVIPGVGATDLGKATGDAAGATDTGVAMLTVRDDALSALSDAEGDYVPLRVDANGALWVTLTAAGNSNVIQDDAAFTPGTSYVGAAGFLADETTPDSVDEGDIGAARMTLDRKQLVRIVGADDANRWDVDASGHGQIDLAAVSVTAVPVSKDGNANSALNPLFVQVVTTAVSSDEVHSYDTQSSLASDTADNHDYAVTGTTFLLRSVLFASSGGMKVEVQTGPVASLATKAVAFLGKEGGFGQLVFDPPIEVPVTSTGTVRVIRTNRQGQAQDVYSTIIGNDVA